jgi:hypothetical protein
MTKPAFPVNAEDILRPASNSSFSEIFQADEKYAAGSKTFVL